MITRVFVTYISYKGTMVIRTVKQEDYNSIYHFVKTAFETA